jgi:predicted SnoaL-like aldol condensation-catalyzing enzyme
MPDTSKNRQIVLDFYEAALNEKDAEKASKFMGEKYIQHNPHVADGPEGLIRMIKFRREKFPQGRNEVKRVIADGDIVALQVHSVLIPGTPGRKIVDIFRVENDKVVEHWDVIQPIDDELYPPIHDNGWF